VVDNYRYPTMVYSLSDILQVFKGNRRSWEMCGGGKPRIRSRINLYTFLSDNLIVKYHLINLGLNRKIILQGILNRLHTFV